MGEVIITAKNFDKNMRMYSHEKFAEFLCKKLKGILEEGYVAIVYINGCTHYLMPIKEGILGFGSGQVEIIFKQKDDKSTIKAKFLQYFSKGYADTIGYSGTVIGKHAFDDIKKYCKWDLNQTSSDTIGYFAAIHEMEDIYDLEEYCITGINQTSTKIFYIMGKSASGKDTILKEIRREIPSLKPLVTYTTRPIREGEVNGIDYHFIDQETFLKMKAEKKILESRKYNTVQGPWIYATAKVEEDGAFIGIGTLKSYMKLKEYYRGLIYPIYISLDDNERLKRAFERELRQKKPNLKELCRRALADDKDFSDENLEKAGIKRVFRNHVLHCCVDEICAQIWQRMPKKESQVN